jgi:hypothetical protein
MVISKLLDVAWDQWNHRNSINHDTLHPWKKDQIEILNNKIGVEYSLGNNALNSAAQKCVRRPLAATLQLNELMKL